MKKAKMRKDASVREKGAFLRDAVFAANDGLITTFAVVAGSQGASFSSRVVIILGLANLVADGLSMASGNFLGVKSEVDYETRQSPQKAFIHSALPHALVTFSSFSLVGILPLLPYFLELKESFVISVVCVALLLFVIGSFRTIFTKKKWFVGGIEMFLIGGIAALFAYLVGLFLNKYII